MKIKIKVRSFAGVQNYSHCQECEWGYEGSKAAYYARQHVKKNPSHVVVRAVGSEYIYSVEEKR